MAGKTETIPWDPADDLATPESLVAYLQAAFEDGTPDVIAAAVGDVARARGATAVARDAGISREALYKAFAEDGNPTLSTLLNVLRVLNITLHPQAIA